jgi:hypothetical protein
VPIAAGFRIDGRKREAGKDRLNSDEFYTGKPQAGVSFPREKAFGQRRKQKRARQQARPVRDPAD